LTTVVVPVFPLPDFFLFPTGVAPLHIFEERYRQMVNDLLDRAGRLVMASIPSRLPRDPRRPPHLFPVGCLAEIISHEKLRDGRFVIFLLGLARVAITEVESDRLYRMVSAEIRRDREASEEEDLRLRPDLETAIEARTTQKLELETKPGVGLLADILAQSLRLEPEWLEEIFAMRSAARRAETALRWHRQLP
jgi:Lon protease-like protein